MSLTGPEDDAEIAALTDSRLYTIGAYFCDRHPELVDDVLAQGEAIEQAGLAGWARTESVAVEVAFQTLMTALGIRYFTAIAGPGTR